MLYPRLTKKEEQTLDDLWVKLFAFHIGCDCPNRRVKDKFIHYVMEVRKNEEGLTEEFVFNQLPKFINYLAEI